MKVEDINCPQCGQDMRLPADLKTMMSDVQRVTDVLLVVAANLDDYEQVGIYADSLRSCADALEKYLTGEK